MSRIARPRHLMTLCAAMVVVAALLVPVTRLIAAIGDLDPSFGTGGTATLPSITYETVTAVAVQADGKILAAGPNNRGIRLVRLNTDGTVDTAFGISGMVDADLSGEDELREEPVKVLVRPDGRIVVVAGFDGFGSERKIALLQYNPNGSPDLTFGVGGIGLHTPLGTFGYFTDAVLQADGGVLAAGYAFVFGPEDDYTVFTVHRFKPDGVVDPFFGTGGVVMTSVVRADEAFGIAVQPDGRFILAGTTQAGTTAPFRDIALARYLPSGVLDTSFGTNGTVVVDPSFGRAQASFAYDVLVQSDGRIVVGGGSWFSTSSYYESVVVRLMPDGQLDTSFSEDGIAQYPPLSPDGFLFNGRFGFLRLALHANGRLLAADSNSLFGIRPDGTLDPEFHGDGVVRLPGPIFDVTVQDDGKVIIGSTNGDPKKPGFLVMRLLAENTPPSLSPSPIAVTRGTSPRLAIGNAADSSDPLVNLSVAPVSATLPAGLAITDVRVDATSGAVSAIVSPSCAAAAGTFDVQFSITDAGNAVTLATVPVTVLPNPLPTVSIADTSVIEGHTSGTIATIVLTATGTVCAPISVRYTTADASAVASSDYAASTGTATIAAEQSSTQIVIPVAGDLVPENDETFVITLDAPANATIADGHAVVAIRDDEPSVVQFAGQTTFEVMEGDEQIGEILTVKVVRLNGISSPARVGISFGGAEFLSDYYSFESVIAFDIGQAELAVPIIILGDLTAETTETLTMTLTPGTNATIGSAWTARVTIRDNDGGPADVDAPVVVASTALPPNAAGWHKADVSVTLSASDGTGSGVQSITYSLAGAQTASGIVVPAANATVPITAEGVTTMTFVGQDVAGNVSAPTSLVVRIDKTAPSNAIASPQARTYIRNEAVAATYTCGDALSGIAACGGTAAQGTPIDTGSLGAKTFTVTSTDVAGNTTTTRVGYSVVAPPPLFNVRLLYDALQGHNSGSAIPIKLQVEDAAGRNVSSSSLVVEARFVSSGLEIGPAEEEVLDAGHANPLGRFRFVADGAYLFNLKTTGLKSGPYVLVVRIAGDSTLHAAPFMIR